MCSWQCIGSKKAAIEYWYPNEPVHRFISKHPPVDAACIPLHQKMDVYGSYTQLVSAGNPAYLCEAETHINPGGVSYGSTNLVWQGIRSVWSPVYFIASSDPTSVYCVGDRTSVAPEFRDVNVEGKTKILVKCHGKADNPINNPPTQDPVIVELVTTGSRSPILNFNVNFQVDRNYVHPFQLPSIFKIFDQRGVVYSRVSYSQGCPNWRFVCEGKCPPGTCKVTCGNHVCCYNSKGTAVSQYNLL